MVIPVEIKVQARRYACRGISSHELGPMIRFLDEANELGYNIISITKMSEYHLLVVYEATHETETEDDDKSDSN
jgi:hypothetical protein